jgi:ketosteroid isomerase-like protein
VGIEENKRLVSNTWMAFARDDVEAGLANMSDDVTWLVPGTDPRYCGLKVGKDAIRRYRALVPGMFVDGRRHNEIRHIYGEGDTVIFELYARGNLANGKLYENVYCYVFEITGGKIRHIREYADTQKAAELLA